MRTFSFIAHAHKLRTCGAIGLFCLVSFSRKVEYDKQRNYLLPRDVKMQLFVKGETLHAVNVTESDTVEELKEMLSPVYSIPIEEQVLSYGGVVLENEHVLSELVLPGGTLELTGRLYGGEE